MRRAGVRPDEATFNALIGGYAAIARPPTGGRANDDSLGWRYDRETLEGRDGGGGGMSVFAGEETETAETAALTAELDADTDETPVDACFRLARSMRDPRVRLTPSRRTWTAVITACARAGDPARAQEAFDRARARGVKADKRTWTALMNAHASVGDLDATADAYWRMRAEGITPDEATLAAALTAGRRGGGDASVATEVYRDMRSLNVRPNNAGFRQLTEMWVDQAFDVDANRAAAAAAAASDARKGTTTTTTTTTTTKREEAGAPRTPNFLLADVVGDGSGGDGDGDGDGPRKRVYGSLVARMTSPREAPPDPPSDVVDRKPHAAGPGAAPAGPIVDVHGLSTVETRAAVLSVLQALRERRRAMLPVFGDLVIVTGRVLSHTGPHTTASAW
jgi:pentatricopeptide repeat protein